MEQSTAQELARSKSEAATATAYQEIIETRLEEAEWLPLGGEVRFLPPYVKKRLDPAISTIFSVAQRAQILSDALERTTGLLQAGVEVRLQLFRAAKVTKPKGKRKAKLGRQFEISIPRLTTGLHLDISILAEYDDDDTTDKIVTEVTVIKLRPLPGDALHSAASFIEPGDVITITKVKQKLSSLVLLSILSWTSILLDSGEILAV